MAGRADNLDLALRIRADLQRAREELRSAERDLIDFGTAGNKAETGLRGMNQQVDRSEKRLRRFSDTGDRMRRVLGALAGAAAFGALARGAGQVVQNLEEVQRTALALGEPVEQVQELFFVFRQFGLESNDVSDALNTLADRALDAQQGTKGMIEDFRDAGIAVEELRGKDPVELFELLVDRLSRIDDVQRRSAIAVRLFGDELGRRLLPLLVEGSGKVEEMREEIREFGGVLSKDAVDGGAAAAREFRKVREVFSAQFTRAVANSSEEFTNLAETLSEPDTVRGIETLVGGLAKLSGWLIQITTLLADVAEGFGEAFGESLYGMGGRSTRELRDELADLQEQIENPGTINQVLGTRGFEQRRDQIQAELLRRRLNGTLGDTENDEEDEPATDRTPEIAKTPPIREGREEDLAEAAEARRESEDALRDRIRAMEESRRSNQAMVESLEEEIELSQLGSRERAQEIAVRRLNRNATDQQREAVRRLAGELFDLKEQSEDTAEGMSEFFAEAARKIQSSLADFLINPFEEGLDGLLSSFADTLQQMAAEAAAAQITDAVFGSEFGQTGDIGGLLSQGASFLGGLFGGGGGGAAAGAGDAGIIASIFHRGGVVGGAAPSREVSPAAFAGAPRFHTGGIVGLRDDELPIIARRGEEVLTMNDPRHRDNSGDMPVNVDVRVYSRDPDTRVESRAVRARNEARRLQTNRRHL